MATQISLNDGAIASAGALAIQTNGTTQAVSISTGQVATVAQNPILTSGTANGVAYLNGSKVLTTGSALVFNGTSLGVGVTPSVQYSGIKSLQVGSTTNLFDNGASTKFYHNAYTAASGDETYLTDGYAQGYLMASNGQHQWYTAASGIGGATFSFTTAMTLNANGVLALQGASTTATGVGITFPATQSASSNANTLDDYEEGTWTAAFNASTSGTITLSSNTGTYTKVGRVVTINGNFVVSSVSSPLGYLYISGLPFAGGTGAQFKCALSIVPENMNATMTTVLYPTVQGDSNIYVFKSDGLGSVSGTTAADIKATTQIFIGGTYTTS